MSLKIRHSVQGDQEVIFTDRNANAFAVVGCLAFIVSLFVIIVLAVGIGILMLLSSEKGFFQWGNLLSFCAPFLAACIFPLASMCLAVASVFCRRLRLVMKAEGERSDGMEVVHEIVLSSILRCLPPSKKRFISYADIWNIRCQRTEKPNRKPMAVIEIVLRDETCVVISLNDPLRIQEEYVLQLKELFRPRLSDINGFDSMPRDDFDVIKPGLPQHSEFGMDFHHSQPCVESGNLPYVTQDVRM